RRVRLLAALARPLIPEPGIHEREGRFRTLLGAPLHDVRLEGCRRVGDACARSLAQFPTLRNLELHVTGLTDEGLAALAPLPVEVLWLGPRITDRGMLTVGGFRGLKHAD